MRLSGRPIPPLIPHALGRVTRPPVCRLLLVGRHPLDGLLWPPNVVGILRRIVNPINDVCLLGVGAVGKGHHVLVADPGILLLLRHLVPVEARGVHELIPHRRLPPARGHGRLRPVRGGDRGRQPLGPLVPRGVLLHERVDLVLCVRLEGHVWGALERLLPELRLDGQQLHLPVHLVPLHLELRHEGRLGAARVARAQARGRALGRLAREEALLAAHGRLDAVVAAAACLGELDLRVRARLHHSPDLVLQHRVPPEGVDVVVGLRRGVEVDASA
mmetsp:Transcript_54188/g.132468  ORF Transcript_54188/g.132468 Transcript_54188/m.132468 type:complete len:274 (-) Transcript_54188:92-913(-)